MEAYADITATIIDEALSRLATAIAEHHRDDPRLALVGIANGGVPLAQTLASTLSATLGQPIPLGTANIAFQRDDIGRKPIPKATAPTELPFEVEGASIVLVDDVLFTGRTVRAALNELFDQGRPARVKLAILCDRGYRRLPIQPDYLGFRKDIDPSHNLRLTLDPAGQHHRFDITPHA